MNTNQNNPQNPLIQKNKGIRINDNENPEEFFLGVQEEIIPQEDRFLSIKRYEVKMFDCGHAGYLVNFIGGRCSKCRKTVCISCLGRCSKDNKTFCLMCLRKNENEIYFCKKHSRLNFIKSLILSAIELPIKIFEETK